MEISKVNLNLLKTLHLLLQTRSISVASNYLDISQSAVSQSLKQLREFFNDPLLIRGNINTMQLTSLAKLLKPKVALAVKDLEGIFFDNDIFDPKVSDRKFNIAASDLPSSIFLPKLLKSLSIQAPNIKLKIHHPFYMQPSELFENTELDLIIGRFDSDIPETLKSQSLLVDTGICVGRKNHPGLKEDVIEFDELASYPIIMMHGIRYPHFNMVDKELKKSKLNEIVNVSVSSGISPIFAIQNSDFIFITISKILNIIGNLTEISYSKPPKILQSIQYELKQYWRDIHTTDPSHQWFRGLVKQCFTEFTDENQ